MSQPLKLHTPISKSFHSKDYILHPGLQNAVEVAIALGQPLLLTGEPGTGKTKLAFKIADMLSGQDKRFLPEPLVFNTKTTSSARDLFYNYDALTHFQMANIKQSENTAAMDIANYIELHALGKAIALTDPTPVSREKFKTKLETEAKSSVVLIDEIDKAPRDFSNDILNEIESYQFEIKEQQHYNIKKANDQQILVIMTSNSEKNLPDAFLRRCIFYHIPFPNEELLLEIVKAQLGEANTTYQFTDQALASLIQQFGDIRKKSTRKKPATAELVSWIRMLGLNGYMGKGAQDRNQLLLQNLSILVKTQEDLHAVQNLLKDALSENS